MPIRLEQPGLAGLYGAAAVVSKAEKEAQRKQDIQMQQQYQQDMKVLDAQLDLEMYERSKRWEIDKMQLRSQVDFQREEQQRQLKLDSYDNALQQIDKEVLAGRMTEQEAYPLKLKYEMNKMGVDVPTSLLPREQKVDPMKQLIQRFLTDEEVEGIPGATGRIRVISPEGQSGTIEAWELETYKARGFRVIGEAVEKVKKRPIRKPIGLKTTPFTREFRGKF